MLGRGGGDGIRTSCKNEVTSPKDTPVHNRSYVHTLIPLVLYGSPSDTDKYK